MNSIKNSIRFVLMLLGCVWLVWPICAQGIDITVRRDASVEDYDFSWVYWFETHGQRYVREAMQSRSGGRALPWDTPASRRWRGQVIEALVPLLDDEAASVRAAAVLALGRIGDEGVLDRVLPSAGGRTSLLLDQAGEVRLSAWVALGLLDASDEARAALGVAPMEEADEIDRIGQAVAIGVMRKLGRVHAKWLLARLDDGGESLEVKRWCVWAISRHDDPSVDAVFGVVLSKLPSPFVVSQVLGDAAYVQRRGGSEWLVDVLRYHPDVRDWSGYRALSQLGPKGVNGSTPRRLAMETRVAASLSLAELPWIEDKKDRNIVLHHLRRRMVPGNTAEAMDFNRGFDTLAYFMHCEGSPGDRALLYDQMRGFTMLRKDDPGVLAKLEEGQEPTEQDLFVKQPSNEVRGYAALAAGLLIRRATEGTALHADRPVVAGRAIELERLKRRFGFRLMRAVADDREPMGYRAACALALGLTGDERYKAELVVELGKLKGGDEPVLGYGLLALAMLGEERAADPAVRYLTRPGAVRGSNDQLGRRAALRALAVLGPIENHSFAKAWGRDPWMSLHAAEAVAWIGQYDTVSVMLNGLESESATWRGAAVRSLGIVFESTWPSRLSGLLEGSNPTLSLRRRFVEKRKTSTIDDVDISKGEHLGPMGEVYALGDPFYLAMKQGAFDPKEPATTTGTVPPTVGQEAR